MQADAPPETSTSRCVSPDTAEQNVAAPCAALTLAAVGSGCEPSNQVTDGDSGAGYPLGRPATRADLGIAGERIAEAR